MRRCTARLVFTSFFVLAAAFLGTSAFAICGNGAVEAGEDCDDASQNGGTNSCCSADCRFTAKSPDVIVGDIVGAQRYGTVGGITAYSVGTTSCNVGSCWLKWFQNTAEHPVIGQNMYRLKAGRFEQIGQSWLKHGFAALAGSVCSSQCVAPPNGSHLGVNCSDPYDAGLNGTQGRLGPKSAVNPFTGEFPYPDSRITTSGDAIFKRLQAHNDDLDPALNPDASYFVEAQYVTRDDAAAGHGANNASYRPVTVGIAPSFQLLLTGGTVRRKAGIQAWRASDPSVSEVFAQAPGDGYFIVAAKVTALGSGNYHYEYAVENLTSDRAGGSFTVPLPPGTTVTNPGFHDVDYHSGEPIDGTDWTVTFAPDSIRFSTESYDEHPFANALRWGTLYNFRFDATAPPGPATATIGLFKPGTPDSFEVTTVVPAACTASESLCGGGYGEDCDGASDCADADCCASPACFAFDADGDHFAASCDCDDTRAFVFPSAPQLCDGFNDDCNAPGWPAVPQDETDQDGDGVLACAGDCDASNAGVWATPGEARDLRVSRDGDAATISWGAPDAPGCAAPRYDTLRSPLPFDFDAAADCVEHDGGDTSSVDAGAPEAGSAWFYLVRCEDDCPEGDGALGLGAGDVPRAARACP